MLTGPNRFNLYLAALLAIAAAGCHTAADEDKPVKDKKAVATMTVHIEVIPDGTGFSEAVPVFREKPLMITINKSPILSEAEITSAQLVDDQGAFSIQIKLNHRGTMLLESYTASSPGKRLAIHSTFGPKMKETRWLAAPVIRHRISSGTLTFSPDASREEADQIVAGLNAVAKMVEEKSKW